MRLSIKTKRRILSLCALILVLGRVVNFSATLANRQGVRASETVYAETAYTSEMVLPAGHDFSYIEQQSLTVTTRVEDLNISSDNVRKIEAYLSSRGAPLAAHAKDFEKMAVKYNLPYNLMPAIAVIESGGGKYNYRPYNYAGMGGQGNAMVFQNYSQAIEKHAQILRFGFFDKGADTPEEIGRSYCYQCPTWGSKVRGVMTQIDGM